MTTISPFQLLEINLISAQDIYKVSRSMRTYAVAWVHPDRKLTTRVDNHGGTNPTWNDKFIFRVDSQFLQSDTSAIMIEIYAIHWFRDVHVGTVRVLVGNLIPPQSRSYNQNHIGMRFVALQVRRPSGRPQGILNCGVTILDSTMRSMPLYTQLSTSAVGYQKLMGQDELHSNQQGSAQLRRTKSEKSSSLFGGQQDRNHNLPTPNNSMINAPNKINSNNNNGEKNKRGKFVYDKPLSIIDGGEDASSLSLAVKLKAQEGKAESVIGYSASSSMKGMGGGKRAEKKTRSDVGGTRTKHDNQENKDLQQLSNKQKHNWLPNYAVTSKDFAAGSIWSESEVGPSPSEVAAAIAEDRRYRKVHDQGSSLAFDDKWSSLNESEGVKTKLYRWKTEMPAYSGGSSNSSSTIFPRAKLNRRHTAPDGGKFSCFGHVCGYECSIVCGRSDNESDDDNKNGGGKSKNVPRAPSINSVSVCSNY